MASDRPNWDLPLLLMPKRGIGKQRRLAQRIPQGVSRTTDQQPGGVAVSLHPPFRGPPHPFLAAASARTYPSVRRYFSPSPDLRKLST